MLTKNHFLTYKKETSYKKNKILKFISTNNKMYLIKSNHSIGKLSLEGKKWMMVGI